MGDATETERAFGKKVLSVGKVQASGVLHRRIEKVEQ